MQGAAEGGDGDADGGSARRPRQRWAEGEDLRGGELGLRRLDPPVGPDGGGGREGGGGGSACRRTALGVRSARRSPSPHAACTRARTACRRWCWPPP
jgi:hypothetical protein